MCSTNRDQETGQIIVAQTTRNFKAEAEQSGRQAVLHCPLLRSGTWIASMCTSQPDVLSTLLRPSHDREHLSEAALFTTQNATMCLDIAPSTHFGAIRAFDGL